MTNTAVTGSTYDVDRGRQWSSDEEEIMEFLVEFDLHIPVGTPTPRSTSG